jgi:LPXTG-motif cell wall-anchored protein
VAGITLEDGDYTVVVDNDKLGFKVTMTASGLTKVAATGSAQAITVTYNAKVVSLEDATVSEKENTATVKFSNNPDDSTSYSLMEDKTRNYSFTIDGNLLGFTGTSYETDELIKTGLNADGTPATTTQKYHSGTTTTDLSPLQGAVFGLYTDKNCTTPYTNTGTPAFNGQVTSDENGRLKITGLDAGTYYLKEISAPTGYIMDNRTFEITIEATYTEIEAGTYENTDGILVHYDAYKVLNGYKVEVNDGTGTKTSTYNITNQGPNQNKVVDKATYTEATGTTPALAGDTVTPISNTKGTDLPSTGGIGTKIFYTMGAVLVIGAGVVLVSRKRAGE